VFSGVSILLCLTRLGVGMNPTMEVNPYQVLEASREATPNNPPWKPDRLARHRLQMKWLIVFLLNLPVVLFCAMVCVSGAATLGVATAVPMVAILGWTCCLWFPQTMRQIVIGGSATAIFQFFPLPQMLAGSIALEVCEQMGLAGSYDTGPIESFSGGFLATIITAVCLLTIGPLIVTFFSLWKLRKSEPTETANPFS
jgi:hypothetical protein